MDDVPQVKTELLMGVVRDQVEEAVRKVMEAVNTAPAGELIAGSEEAVRDISGELRRQLFEAAIQQRIDAAEAAFPPPVDAQSGKKKRNKGKQPTTVLTVNGRVRLRRTWWHSAADGSEAPIDRVLSRDGATVTRGVCEMACRLNNDAAGFDKAADNLRRAAQVTMCGVRRRSRCAASSCD